MRRGEAGQGEPTPSGRIASEACADHGQAPRTVQLWMPKAIYGLGWTEPPLISMLSRPEMREVRRRIRDSATPRSAVGRLRPSQRERVAG